MMLYNEIIDKEYNHLQHRNLAHHMFGYTSDVFKTEKLSTFWLEITRGRGVSKYKVFFGVERGAKRLHGYLTMKYGDLHGRAWKYTFDYDEVEKIAAIVQDIDDGLAYIYGDKRKKSK